MGISINPIDLVKVLTARRDKTKAKIADYIDSIAEEADGLARIWGEIVEALQRKESIVINDKQVRDLEPYKTPNAPYFTRLAEFYNYLSVAVGGKLEDRWHDSLAMQLGSLIYHREITFKLYLESINSVAAKTTFLDEDSRSADLKNLVQSVSVLQKEAAQIHVLAKTIRAL